MKPSIRSLFKAALPALIVVPAMMQVARAGASNTILPDAAGDVIVAGTFDETNGADWTVLANGGNASPFTVEIKQGASLTGDLSLRNGVEVSVSNYTINNSGALNVEQYGVFSMSGNTVVNNLAGGLIQGGSDGIRFSYYDKSEASLINALSESVIDGGTVVNDGEITGNNNGISADSDLTVTNQTGVITANYGNGVGAGDNLVLTNHGSILGSAMAGQETLVRILEPVFRFGGSGVSAASNASITNTGSIVSMGGNGITSYNDLTLTNSGTIEGNGYQDFEAIASRTTQAVPIKFPGFGSGVYTGDNSTIINEPEGSINELEGTISGKYDGIRAGRFLNLMNEGNISGTNEGNGNAGVTTYGGATITNYGAIHGDLNGIAITNIEIIDDIQFTATFETEPEIDLSSTITNSGSITGTTGTGVLGSVETETLNNANGSITGAIAAIDLGAGDDVTNLGFGSVIHGNVFGGEGIDQINFTSGSESVFEESNIIHGNVGGIETITKTGPGFAFIGGAGESFDVFTDTIKVSSGGLIINGNLASLSEGKTAVILTNGGQLDGTGNWNADLTISSGGISAGGTSNVFNGFDDGIVVPLSAPKNAGEIQPFQSVGTLTLNGSVNAAAPAIDQNTAKAIIAAPIPFYLREDINPQTPIKNGVNSDLIVQNGAGNIFDVSGMDIRLSPTDINKTLTEGTYTLIDSDSPLKGVDALGNVGVQFNGNAPDTGEFIANQSGSNNLNTVLTNYFTTVDTTDPTAPVPLTKAAGNSPDSNLVIKIKHDYEGLPGLTKNQAAFGAALDSQVNSANPLVQDFIAALDYSDLAAVQSTLAALDPGSTLGLVDSLVNSNYRLHRLTQQHLASIRGKGQSTTDTAAPVKDAKGGIVPGETITRHNHRGNAWGSISYDGQDYESAGSSADFDGKSGAFTAGFDWLVAPNLVVGLVLDGSKGDYDGSGMDSDVESYRGAVYGTWGSGMGFYSDALLGYGDHDLGSKTKAAGILAGGTSSDTGADSLQAMWTAGYTMGDERVKHGPFAGLEYQNVDVDGFTQKGPFPISVGGYDVDSLRGLIGYRVDANLGTFRPYASVAYAHEFEDGSNNATASFGGASFKVTGAEQSSAFLISLGTGISLTESLTLDLGYRGDIATDDGLTSHGGSLGLNYSF